MYRTGTVSSILSFVVCERLRLRADVKTQTVASELGVVLDYSWLYSAGENDTGAAAGAGGSASSTATRNRSGVSGVSNDHTTTARGEANSAVRCGNS